MIFGARPEPPNAARPAKGTVLCSVEDIAEPGGKTFRYRVEGDLFAGIVVRFRGKVRGFIDSCPHAGAPLAYDERYLFSGDHLLCSSHGALFGPLDGFCVAGPCVGAFLRKWPVKVKDGKVMAA